MGIVFVIIVVVIFRSSVFNCSFSFESKDIHSFVYLYVIVVSVFVTSKRSSDNDNTLYHRFILKLIECTIALDARHCHSCNGDIFVCNI